MQVCLMTETRTGVARRRLQVVVINLPQSHGTSRISSTRLRWLTTADEVEVGKHRVRDSKSAVKVTSGFVSHCWVQMV